jgi:hypothetical protein
MTGPNPNSDRPATLFAPPIPPLFVAFICFTGCAATQPAAPKPGMAQEGRKLFGTTRESSAAKANPAHAGDDSWSIVIEVFSGPNAEQSAREGLARLRSQVGLADARAEHRGQNWVLAYGRYPASNDPKAAADLERVKSFEYRDGRPFAGAYLSAPQLEGTVPEYDLRNAKALNGDWVVYTLQVGVYALEGAKTVTAGQMQEVRQKAEEAALGLRQQGEQAFYYHGPNRSMVTLGLFEAQDVDAELGTESERVTMLRKRQPLNLLNGRGIKEFHRGVGPDGRPTNIERMQPSRIVMIPEK